jgi:uncharacterized protein YggE
MNCPTRSMMRALLIVLAPSLALAGQAPVQSSEPLVVTTGEGVVQAVPDRAWVTITAESRGSNPREAQRRNAEAMEPVQAKIRAAGVPADAIRTAGYDLQQEWDFVNNRRVSRGYVARNTIEVRVDSVDRVGEILELAVGSGATSVGGVRFDLKERSKLEREALRLAVADARARADAAAAGTGRTVERVLRIEERGIATPVPMPFAASGVALRQAAQAEAPPIAAGQMELRAQVTLTAVLK